MVKPISIEEFKKCLAFSETAPEGSWGHSEDVGRQWHMAIAESGLMKEMFPRLIADMFTNGLSVLAAAYASGLISGIEMAEHIITTREMEESFSK